MTESQALLTDLWRFGATILVLAMQAGFLLLEAGNVRSKNSINVAQKNVTDLTLCWVAFLAVGFSIAFGLPSPLWSTESSTPIIEFLFQLGFCGAAATIIAGAVAERMSFAAYAFLTVAVVVLIYPVAAWSAWGNLLIEHRPALLADLGFVDFAGGTVVHATAAAVALAAVTNDLADRLVWIQCRCTSAGNRPVQTNHTQHRDSCLFWRNDRALRWTHH